MSTQGQTSRRFSSRIVRRAPHSRRDAEAVQLLRSEAQIFDVAGQAGARRWRISTDAPLSPAALRAIETLRAGGDRFLFMSAAERDRLAVAA